MKEGHGWDEMPSLRAETWRAMERALEAGKCRAIGVSNFTVAHLRELKKTAKVMPMVNQVEFHPYHVQVRQQESGWMRNHLWVVLLRRSKGNQYRASRSLVL